MKNTVWKRHFGKITVQRPRHSGNLKVGVRDGRANLLTGVGARDALKKPFVGFEGNPMHLQLRQQ